MKSISLYFILFSIVSCSSPFKRLMYGGKIVQTNFHETIPFDFSKRLPMIKVKIQGGEYTFLLDSGAPNVISKELSEKLKYKVVSSPHINDSQGVKRKQQSIKIKNIRIGEIDFEDTGAIILDYRKVYKMDCYDFDGIIGSNLMAKAIWEIDYEKFTISFSDKLSSFSIPDDAYKIPFTPKKSQQTPVVKIKINELLYERVTFDTGASGAVGLRVENGESVIDSLEGVDLEGSVSTGVYGDGAVSTTRYAKVDSMSIGDIKLRDQIVDFENQGSMTLGNKFLKNYRVIMDWSSNNILLIQTKGYDEREYRTFGWLPTIKDQKMYVNGIVKGSIAEQMGLALETQVTKINNVDYQLLSYEAGCQFITERFPEEMDTMNLTILKDGKEVEIILPKETFIGPNKN